MRFGTPNHQPICKVGAIETVEHFLIGQGEGKNGFITTNEMGIHETGRADGANRVGIVPIKEGCKACGTFLGVILKNEVRQRKPILGANAAR
jgi:hypothetical protein